MKRRPARVLIVDDDLDLRSTIRDLLVDEGYEVSEASDGVIALAHLRAHPRPDLILLDLMMPNMDGVQFREEQMKTSAFASIPTVLLTASTQSAAARATRADQMLQKPVQLEPLLNMIARYLPAPIPHEG